MTAYFCYELLAQDIRANRQNHKGQSGSGLAFVVS
jgi:hypothetical protein